VVRSHLLSIHMCKNIIAYLQLNSEINRVTELRDYSRNCQNVTN